MKKLLAILIILLLTFGPSTGPSLLLAEEASPSPEPSPVIESSPEPSPESTPEPSPVPNIDVNQTAEITDQVDSLANAADNQIVEPSPSPEILLVDASPSPSPAIEAESSPSPEPSPTTVETGDITTVAEITNQVNTSQVNSQVVNKTLNIFASGDIDLSDLSFLSEALNQTLIITNETVNLSYNGHQLAQVDTQVVAWLNSGNNTIDGAQAAVIKTGDIYNVVSVVNQVNSTIIDSTIYIITINIFGTVNGNIILPELPATIADQSNCCQGNISVNQTATVSSQVSVEATTGGNLIADASEALIEPGDITSLVNVTDVVNKTIIGSFFQNLVIQTLGNWTGSFLGWGETNQNGTICTSCLGDISIDQAALISNTVDIDLNTGGNQILNSDSAGITTGDIFSAVSLVNLVNTAIIRSTGFFGFINIFGWLNGNIGGASQFAAPSPEPEVSQTTTSSDTDEPQKETGGQLTVTNTNNVGEYVLPGDTVTFEFVVKNTGAGRVYETQLQLDLINGDAVMTVGTINLGDIEPKHYLKISTGATLTDEAEGGTYFARVTVNGLVGPDDQEVTASAESRFLLAAFSPVIDALSTPAQAEEESSPILGASIAANVTPYQKLLKLFWIMLALYSLMLAYEKREKLAYAAMALRSLIFSLLLLVKSP